MDVEEVLNGVKVFAPLRHRDDRGFFSETYSKRLLAEHGIDAAFVQDNHSLSLEKGTIRGLHFQIPPSAQAKLVRVTRGAVLDVVVDLRHGSPTFAEHAAFELTADNWRQVYVPAGFAHGFCTLGDAAEVLYKVTDYYSPQDDAGLRWNDPALAIDWPVTAADAILSQKDASLPLLAELPAHFQYRHAGTCT